MAKFIKKALIIYAVLWDGKIDAVEDIVCEIFREKPVIINKVPWRGNRAVLWRCEQKKTWEKKYMDSSHLNYWLSLQVLA